MRLPHLCWAGILEGCWCHCPLGLEWTLQVGLSACGWSLSSFHTTNTHLVSLGLASLQHASLEATHTHICISFSSASIPTLKNASVLTSVHVCLPLETVLMSCHRGFLWPPGCWRTAGLWLGAERTRHACCCLATTQRCLALCAGAAVCMRKVRITKQWCSTHKLTRLYASVHQWNCSFHPRQSRLI